MNLDNKSNQGYWAHLWNKEAFPKPDQQQVFYSTLKEVVKLFKGDLFKFELLKYVQAEKETK